MDEWWVGVWVELRTVSIVQSYQPGSSAVIRCDGERKTALTDGWRTEGSVDGRVGG